MVSVYFMFFTYWVVYTEFVAWSLDGSNEKIIRLGSLLGVQNIVSEDESSKCSRTQGKEERGELYDRLCETSGGQDHGHRVI